MQLVKVLYCKLQTNGKRLPAFPHEVRPGFEPLISEVGGVCVTAAPPRQSIHQMAVICTLKVGHWIQIYTQEFLVLIMEQYLLHNSLSIFLHWSLIFTHVWIYPRLSHHQR